ncbi:MAG: adenylyl-sulfate kinase [Alphaproteobacteria bacterium]|nr:adenylyl-sulfate kinase [Alphaproteobacteria bacterium]
MSPRATNITPVGAGVTAEMRAKRFGHKGGVIWLTGLSGAGKSSLALETERRLFAEGYLTYALDGDNLRAGINSDLGFTPEERLENVRRAAHIASLLAGAGHIVIAAFVSPEHSHRAAARATAPSFHEVYVKADLETCERRDIKGLYKLARMGQIKDFTGVSAPYEVPQHPDLILDTMHQSVAESVEALVAYIRKHYPLHHA